MIYGIGISAIGLAYVWQSGDLSKLALVLFALVFFSPWTKD